MTFCEKNTGSGGNGIEIWKCSVKMLIHCKHCRLLSLYNPLFRLHKRYRYKKKWAIMRKKPKEATELALEHFDMFYKPVLQKKWPKVREALMSNSKYCALINNFGDGEDAVEILTDRGAYDIVKTAAVSYEKLIPSMTKSDQFLSRASVIGDIDADERMYQLKGEGMVDENQKRHTHSHCPDNNNLPSLADLNKQYNSIETEDEIIDSGFVNSDMNSASNVSDEVVRAEQDYEYDEKYRDLYSFVPTEAVYSERDLLHKEMIATSTFSPEDIPISIVPSPTIVFPDRLQAYALPRGDRTEFPASKANVANVLSYYLMDAASLVPVIALDIQPGESVLDLCAAPGGKSLAILQMLKIKNITCNDLSGSRQKRLQRVLECYLGPDIKSMSNIKIKTMNGLYYKEPQFDKVLVDVPCNTDRHVLQENENNLFTPGRFYERLELPDKQKNLLLAGIKSCQPGGSVVYSTCTLSPRQNDGVIQNVCQHIWRETSMEVEIHDLSLVTKAFTDTFNFFKCRFGHLVMPSRNANFGPSYFCKLKRIK